MYLTFSSLSLHSFYPTPSRHSNHLIYCLTLISQSFIPLNSLLSPHSLTSSSFLTRLSTSPYSSPKSPAPVISPHFPTTPLSPPSLSPRSLYPTTSPTPYIPHSLISLTPLSRPTFLQLISAPSHSHNFSTYMYYYIPFIPPTLLPNPFAGLSPSHLTFSTYSPNQLR